MKKVDALIVGSGIAGLTAALTLAEKKRHVLVVTKKRVMTTATNLAQGGIAAVLSGTDNFAQHIEDTLIAGCYHNNKKALSYMVRHGAEAVEKLLRLGVPFATHRGEFELTQEGGHSSRRVAFVGDYTGHAIEKALVKNARSSPYITFWENTPATELLVRNGRCYGARVVHDVRSINILSSITVLATGGCGQLYSHTTTPSVATGEGIALAHNAGCVTHDLEFIQFHPTAFFHRGKPQFLISEAVRGEGAYIVNEKGERFMVKVHPRAELAPRDIVSRAIFEEEKSGAVFLDLRHLPPKEVEMRFPTIFSRLSKYGFNMAKDLIRISPAAHYLCGGVEVDIMGKTTLDGLYAYGEVACTGVHGANRLASNSLLEAAVFAARVGEAPVQTVKTTPRFSTKHINLKSTPAQKKNIRDLKQNLRRTMWQSVGIVRTKESLTFALKTIVELTKKSCGLDQKNLSSIELNHLLTTSRLITQAALARRSSLGCHFRLN